MFSAVDGFRFININVANGYIATLANAGFFTGIPTSDGNVLRLGGEFLNGSDNDIGYVALNNAKGARIISEKVIGNVSVNQEGLCMTTIPSSNSSILVGQNANSAYITYLDSSNNISWQKQLNSNIAITGTSIYSDVTVEDSGSNIYASGTVAFLIGGSSFGIAELVKYNSSGTILSQDRVPYINELPTGVFSAVIYDLLMDSANNLYITGRVPQSFDGNITYKTSGSIRKQNSSGTLVWDNGLFNTTGNIIFNQSIVDTANNVYTIGSSDINPYPEIIAKFYSNGALSWQKQISNVSLLSLTTDSIGNVYVGGRLSPDIANALYFSLDSNTGNINWQNFINSGNNGNIYLNDINYANNFIYVGGYTDTTNLGLAMKLPSNGTGTGQHGSYTISTGNVVISTSSLSEGGANFNFTSTSYAVTTPTESIKNGSTGRRIIPL
jgi:hypothetical protein